MGALLGLEVKDLEELIGSGEPSYRARQLYTALYRERRGDLSEVTTFPRELRERLSAGYRVGLPSVSQRFESTDGTRRYLLALEDGKTVETVLMPEDVGRTPSSARVPLDPPRPTGASAADLGVRPTLRRERQTICISSQVGCPVACRFCLTALLGLERNLTAGEIVGQVLRVAADNGLDVESERVNIVMMGQGEPLLNLPAVLKATRILTDPEGVALSPRRITLSTAGIIPAMEELGREPVRPKLAISLNASSEQQRRELMPITRKYHLADLMEACRRYPLRPWERLTFEYVLLKGVNDTDADARRVVRLLANLKCKMNLISWNPGPEIPYESPEPERVLAFQEIVKRAIPCFVRKPRGRDIYAACGQLKRMAG